MLIISEKIKMKDKTEEKGIAKNTGKEYTNKSIYIEDKSGIIHRLTFVNDMIYNKAEKDKNYILKYYISTNGRIDLNDIEEVK